METLEQFRYKNGGSCAETVTDADGNYTLPRLLPGDYDVLVRLNGNLGNDWTAGAVDVSLKVGEHRQHLNPEVVKGAMISGKVTLADTNAVVGDMSITIQTEAASSLDSWSVKTDSSGHYQLRVPAGKRQVYVSGAMPDGYARSSGESELEKDLVLEEGGIYTADFALARENQIRGVVVNPSGEPVAGASVSCLQPMDRMGHPINVMSDPAGKFSIVLPAGTESVELMAEFDAMVTLTDVKYPINVEARLELKANGFASATGRVVDEAGKPIEGAHVWCNGKTINGEPIRLTTDAEGRYETKRLLPGKQIVFYGSKDGYGENSSFSAFKAGQAVDLEPIVLPKADASVAGRVVDSAGNSVAGASVAASGYLQPRDGVKIVADSDGKFTLRGLVAGWLDVKATRMKKEIPFETQKRVRTGSEDIVITLPDEPSIWKMEALVDQVGKPAPPLRAQDWFHTASLPERQLGKVRLIQFVGLDRPLIFFSNTLPPLQKLREEFPEPELEIIVVHGAWPKQEVAEILAKDYPDFKLPLAIEPEAGAMSKAFGVQHWLTVVIDQQGKVAFQSRGDWDKAKKKVRELLGKK